MLHSNIQFLSEIPENSEKAQLRWSLATYRFQSSLLGHTNWVPSLQHFGGGQCGLELVFTRLSTSIELRVIH